MGATWYRSYYLHDLAKEPRRRSSPQGADGWAVRFFLLVKEFDVDNDRAGDLNERVSMKRTRTVRDIRYH